MVCDRPLGAALCVRGRSGKAILAGWLEGHARMSD
jgi:hypothetical protein